MCCFHLLTTVYSAAMNMSVQISVLFFFFNRRYPNGWRRKWLSTPVFLPGKFPGQRNLGGYSPWGGKEPDMTERLGEHAQCAVAINDGGSKANFLKRT